MCFAILRLHGAENSYCLFKEKCYFIENENTGMGGETITNWRQIFMEAMRIEQLYEQHIKPLPSHEQLKLVELIVRKMARDGNAINRPKRSIMELHGLGAEIWEGIDAQEYVNKLREEWDHRP
jgi:hypothetical protein